MRAPARASASVRNGKPDGEPQPSLLPRLFGPSTNIAIILIAIVVIFAALRFSEFFTVYNLTNIANSAAILLVMGVGETFVIVTAGVDLSVGSVLVFSGVIAGEVMSGNGWGTGLIGIVVAIACGIAWGIVNGIVVAKGKVPPLIVTLGSFGAAQGLAEVISGGNDLHNIPSSLVNSIGVGDIGGLPYLVIIATVIAVAGGVVLSYTRFGRHTYAIGSNAEAARRASIKVDRHLIQVYALAGALAGAAGILSFAYFGTTTLAGHATDNLNVIAAVVIGGTSLFGGSGLVFGTVVGALIPAVLSNGLVILGVSSFWQDVAVGVVLVAAVYLDQLRRRKQFRR
jgi:ribose transport system permease protein